MRIETIGLYEAGLLPAQQNAGPARLTAYLTDTDTGIAEGRTGPAVLILPGGGYCWTSPREAQPVALRFLAHGWQAFVLEYSCAPAVYPAALREAAAALRLIRERGAEWGVDPAMTAVLGFSAGGHLAGTLAMRYDSAGLSDIGSPELLRPDVLLLGYPVTVSYGRYHKGSFDALSGGDEALAEELSLDRMARPDMPPVFLWHTRNDASVPVYGSLRFLEALEQAGVDFAVHIYRCGHHGLATADILSYPSMYLPEISADIPRWTEEAIAFCAEKGFAIHDKGGKQRI